jgi:prevent-host-death family protein
MTISVIEDIKPVSELKRNTTTLLKHVRETGRPLVLTVGGKADVVLMDARIYNDHLRSLHLARLLSEAEESLAAGKSRPAREFFKEFKHAKKASR